MKPAHVLWIVAVAMLASVPVQTVPAATVEVAETAGGDHTLLVDGEPFQIKGAGGGGDKPLLASLGGNSFRTWGVGEDTQATLDEAERLGLKVTVGIWLGHERHGFDYADVDSVAEQLDNARKWVERYKDHPALLMWAVGNEMEGFGAGDNANVWLAVDQIAGLIQRLDPNHPVMSVIVEVGGKRVEAVHKLCPNVDVVGINSYGGVASIPKRYREAGGTKPYVVTEFGPPGTWEVPKGPLGAPHEWTSTEKARFYRAGYEAVASDPLSLGSYAFTWGNKQEATATWFGLLLPDGSKLEGVDALSELWSGQPPANRCPRIESIELSADRAQPGQTIEAKLLVRDPEGDELETTWVLHDEEVTYETGGDARPPTAEHPEAIVTSDVRRASIKLPTQPGLYRLYAYVRDGQGSAAMANLPIRVNP